MQSSLKYLRPEVLATIHKLELRARLVVEGFISGVQQSPYQGYSVEFASHREYVPGDDVRHIDWRVYGKADRFYIKQYEEETNLRVYLLLDASGSMLYPDADSASRQGVRKRRMNKWDYAATLAASLSFLTAHQQDAAGLILFDSEVRRHIAPGTSRAHSLELVEAIAATVPDRTTDMKMMFSQLAEHVRRRSLVVIISDLLADPDAVISGLRRLRHSRHDVIVLHVLDHDELEFPFAENILFEGLEEPGVQVLTDPQSLRRSYREAVDSFVRRIRGSCLDERIDYELLSTRDSLDGALRAFLSKRMRARR